jgi:large subunit ribosomal protein L28
LRLFLQWGKVRNGAVPYEFRRTAGEKIQIRRLLFVETDKFSKILKNLLIFFAISGKMYLVDKSVKEVPAMAKCEICGKGVTFGIKVSHSHRRTNRTWKPNVQRVKAIVKGSPCHIYVCSRCLRSGKVERANG